MFFIGLLPPLAATFGISPFITSPCPKVTVFQLLCLPLLYHFCFILYSSVRHVHIKHCFIPEKCSFLLLKSKMVMHLCRSFYSVFLCLDVWCFAFHAFPAQLFSHLVTRYLFERCLHETPSLAFGCKCCQGRDHICLLHSFLSSVSQSLCIVGPQWIFVEWMTPWINKAHEPWACQLPF